MAKSTTGTKTKKQTKTETAPVETTPAPVVEAAPVTVTETQMQSEAPVDTQVEESSTELLFKKLLSQFQDVQNVMKTLHSNLKILEKEVAKEKKESRKMQSKKMKKTSSAKKQLSGFAKASPISNDLADFLGLAHDAQIARTEVTSKVIAYVKANNLQNPEKKKIIVPDAKLGAVLQSGDNEVTFFNLQTYLKKHFLPSTTTATQAPTVV